MFAKKSLGQNFLMHRQTAERIVVAAALPENALVLEIGPGTGMLTKELLAAGHRVVAVEADNALAPELEETFKDEVGQGKLRVVHGDIREFDPKDVGETYHLVANIPYYITGEIIRQFLTAAHKPRSMTLLVQKEVAERIARSKKESLLSLSVKAYGEPKYCFTVPRGAFRPAPNVDSAVLYIGNVGSGAFKGSEASFFEVLHVGFAHKRKRLAKNLAEKWGSDAVTAAFARLALPENIRAEDLSLERWLGLANELTQP
ncbi:MAG TPA: 16S rRNA (adenine(1518)-N(6)/adenine(1519)-N(6))-dimethyltransferase RsmA [Candidatus Paceibacterota bacterium]